MVPTYTALNNALKKTPEKINAAQAHGLLCGLICATSDPNNTQWVKLLLGDAKNEDCKDLLAQLYALSFQQLSDFSFEFNLLLPTDSKDINLRTEALGLWCQGFLTGLSQAHVNLSHRPPGEVTDALKDITEIAQVNFGDIVDTDEDEGAYFELIEYVRLAVLMIFQELNADSESKEMDQTDFLH